MQKLKTYAQKSKILCVVNRAYYVTAMADSCKKCIKLIHSQVRAYRSLRIKLCALFQWVLSICLDFLCFELISYRFKKLVPLLKNGNFAKKSAWCKNASFCGPTLELLTAIPKLANCKSECMGHNLTIFLNRKIITT